MNQYFKGTVCGILAAVSYGTNPLGALSLYEEGINPTSVLSYRFSLATIILAVVMLFRKESFRVSWRELGILASLGFLFAISSLSLFYSFKFMDAGVASTLLFVYPIMVALIMMSFFKEKLSIVTVLSILLAFVGIMLLYYTGEKTTLDPFGVILVELSSLSYAIYIVIMDRSKIHLSPIKTNLYVIFFCFLGIVLQSFLFPGAELQLLPSPRAWGYALFLALVPGISALVLLSVACRTIGSTPTAILGALEPLTAVLIGIFVFNEAFTVRLALGIVLILLSVILIVLARRRPVETEKRS